VSRDLTPVRAAAPVPAAGPGRRRRDLAEPVAYGVLGICVLAVLVLTDRGWFAPDTRPELYLAPGRALARSLARREPPPRYSATRALLRNLALYPVVLGHGVRRLWPF